MKRINETFWCAVNPDGVWIIPFIQWSRKDVKECLDGSNPMWKKEGWRIARFKVVEITKSTTGKKGKS